MNVSIVSLEGDAWRGMFPLPSLKEREVNPMEEIWKDIEGYEGLYRVSNMGRIYGVKNNIIRKPSERRFYLRVNLTKNGVSKHYTIHRLVAEAFCPKRGGANEVNHINENKHDNRAVNLEWCTRLENIHHGTGIARQAATHRELDIANFKRRPIQQFSLNGDFIAEYRSINDACRATGVKRQSVGKCAAGKGKTAYGFVWKFV